jgi:predicted RNA binding protein YcfA (HicA-like mRNA interferase family)
LLKKYLDVRDAVSQRDKLVEKMRNTPHNIRFAQTSALLRYEAFVLFNKRGSHRTYHHADGRLITVVVPHGKRKTCHPKDVSKLLKVLGL